MKKILLIILISFLLYSRFVNLSWGLPYPFHPDERNMADAIVRLHCSLSPTSFHLSECFNPQFYAYGQFPLYLGYILVQFSHLMNGRFDIPVSFIEAVLSLRFISFVSAVLTALLLLKIISFIQRKNISLLSLFIITYVPALIQFSHFGTTESILMCLISSIVYHSLVLQKQRNVYPRIFFLAFLTGLAISIKISAIPYVLIPIFALIIAGYVNNKKTLSERFLFILHSMFRFGTGVALSYIIFSPQNIISLSQFASSMQYEGGVALGSIIPFYTRQFIMTIPLVFQGLKIFPYSLGWPLFFFALCGFFLLPVRDKRINLLRLAVLVSFLPNAFMFAKWTRFIAPTIPLLVVFGYLLIDRIYRSLDVSKYKGKIVMASIVCITVIPGIAFMSVYTSTDVRFVASRWIYEHIDNSSFILSETANVVDLPIEPPDMNSNALPYHYDSFNLYDADTIPGAKDELRDDLMKADYIFVPSRRIFMNLSCIRPNGSHVAGESAKCSYLRGHFPTPYSYYEQLFSGTLGYTQIAEFSSYPRIQIAGKTLFQFPDEEAEESFTVFDHPVIRIYKRNNL